MKIFYFEIKESCTLIVLNSKQYVDLKRWSTSVEIVLFIKAYKFWSSHTTKKCLYWFHSIDQIEEHYMLKNALEQNPGFIKPNQTKRNSGLSESGFDPKKAAQQCPPKNDHRGRGQVSRCLNSLRTTACPSCPVAVWSCSTYIFGSESDQWNLRMPYFKLCGNSTFYFIFRDIKIKIQAIWNFLFFCYWFW